MKKYFPLMLCLVTAFTFTQRSFGQKNISGDWKGDIDLQGTKLPIVFHLIEIGDSLDGTWDSPAQNAFGLAFTSIKIKGDSLLATIKNLNATYSGKFVVSDSITGLWKQGPVSFPLSLKWHEKSAPAQEFNDEKEINIPVSKDVHISGTLLSGSTDAPLVILIAGSGPTDRNGNNPLGVASNTYQMLAHQLYKNQIGSFRYDKRGIGKSAVGNMNESEMRFMDFAADADSIVGYFKRQGYEKIFIAGHSEGSLLGMLVAEKEKLSGYISISGVGFSADKIFEKQLSGKIPGMSDSAIVAIVDQIKDGKTVTDFPSMLATVFRPSVQPYLTSWFQYDPREEIKEVDCPILIIQGTCDMQVGVENATALFNAANKATIKIIPQMSHTLKDAGKDCVNEKETYTNKDLPLAPGLVEDMVKFIIK